MHHLVHTFAVLLIPAIFVVLVIKLHMEDVRATTPTPAVKVCHATCAYVNLHSGQVRSVEPGFIEFCIEHLLNNLAGNGAKSRLHLKPEPV